MPYQRKFEKFSTNDFKTRLGQARYSECMEIKVHCYQHQIENNWILCSDCRPAYSNELSDKKRSHLAQDRVGMYKATDENYNIDYQFIMTSFMEEMNKM